MAAARPREQSPLFSILRAEAVHLSVTVTADVLACQMNRLGCRSAPCPGRGRGCSATLALLHGWLYALTWKHGRMKTESLMPTATACNRNMSGMPFR